MLRAAPMTVLSSSSPSCTAVPPNLPSAQPGEISLPRWVEQELDRASDAAAEPNAAQSLLVDGVPLRVRDAGKRALISARLGEASSLSAGDLRAAVGRAYLALFSAAAQRRARHLIRLWNFIPVIHEPLGDDLDRYRVFNLGRFDAFSQSLGGDQAFARHLPTATGVGHAGRDLVIHALLSSELGLHVENPRQTPAYRYSSDHGPLPPCFARATIAAPRLLVGGTSSVRREDSMHRGDIPSQLAETLDNLAALINAARRRFDASSADEPADAALRRFTHARLYHTPSTDERMLRQTLARHMPDVPIEMVRADICRRELDVEIEGVVDLGSSPAGRPHSPPNPQP